MATDPLGAAARGAPRARRAAGYRIWRCQRKPHLSSQHAAILQNIQQDLAGFALHDSNASTLTGHQLKSRD